MAASLFERWIATLASVASETLARFRPTFAIEAVEEGDGFVLRRVDGGEIGRVGPDGALAGVREGRFGGTAVGVHLGDRYRIVDRVAYPAGTQAYLGAVIGNQIDRLAPFEEGDAVFAWKLDEGVSAADTAADAIGVTVSVVSRRRVIEAVRPLVMAGFVPAQIMIGSGDVAPPVVVSLGGGDRDGARMRQLANGVVVTLVLIGVAGYLGTWWLQHGLDSKLDALETTLAARRLAVEQAALAGNTAVGDAKRISDLAANRAQRNALPMLDRLSILLPDSVYLTNLEMEGTAVRISGLAVDAAPLVPLLENDPQIENVHFVAPLSSQAESGRVGFDLAFTWLPRP